MAVLKCENGHFYDGAKFSECPHCKEPLPMSRTLNSELTQFGFVETAFSTSNVKKEAVRVNLGAPQGNDEKTVGIFREKLGIEPVVGWLVCTQGREKGRAYVLHSGRNFVGRNLKSDIAIPDDASVSGEDHCSIVFEPNKIIYMLARGKGETVLINQQPLDNTYILTGDESIEIGTSRFVFVPYCKEGRTW